MFLLLLHGCSLLAQKVDQLQELMAENSRRLLNREDTALQYKRCFLEMNMMMCCRVTLFVLLLVLGAVCWNRRWTFLLKWQLNDWTIGRIQLSILRGVCWDEHDDVLLYHPMSPLVLGAVCWNRRLTRCQLNSPENCRRERMQLCSITGV